MRIFSLESDELLRHGYLNCMNMCYLLLEGFPRFDDPPSLDEILQLARGVPRKRYPKSVFLPETEGVRSTKSGVA